MVQFAFDGNSVEERSTGVLEPGLYQVAITNSEEVQTKAGNGYYIKMEYTVVSDVGNGRKVFMNYNHKNPNPEAVRIAMMEFGEMCRAAGMPNITDTAQLHGKNIELKLGVKQDGEYTNNVVQEYRSVSGAQQAPTEAPQQQQAGGGPQWN